MKSFVIIFRQSPRAFTDAELTQRQREVSTWAREQNAAGRQLDPRILDADVWRPPGAATASDCSTAAISALLFLQANDLSDAGAVAASHPANRYGGSIEVRPWAPPGIPATPSVPAVSAAR